MHGDLYFSLSNTSFLALAVVQKLMSVFLKGNVCFTWLRTSIYKLFHPKKFFYNFCTFHWATCILWTGKKIGWGGGSCCSMGSPGNLPSSAPLWKCLTLSGHLSCLKVLLSWIKCFKSNHLYKILRLLFSIFQDGRHTMQPTMFIFEPERVPLVFSHILV